MDIMQDAKFKTNNSNSATQLVPPANEGKGRGVPSNATLTYAAEPRVDSPAAVDAGAAVGVAFTGVGGTNYHSNKKGI